MNDLETLERALEKRFSELPRTAAARIRTLTFIRRLALLGVAAGYLALIDTLLSAGAGTTWVMALVAVAAVFSFAAISLNQYARRSIARHGLTLLGAASDRTVRSLTGGVPVAAGSLVPARAGASTTQPAIRSKRQLKKARRAEREAAARRDRDRESEERARERSAVDSDDGD